MFCKRVAGVEMALPKPTWCSGVTKTLPSKGFWMLILLFTFLLEILRVPMRVSSHGTGARTQLCTRTCARHVVTKVNAGVPDGLRGALADYLGKVVPHFNT